MCFGAKGRTGYSDSESFGGSLESLSSPGKSAFFSVTFLSRVMYMKTFLDKHVFFLLYCVPSLLQYIIEAHTNRRLPKTASTLTVSSDDMDERDVASESGLLLPLYASKTQHGNYTAWLCPLPLPSEYIDSQPVKVRTLSRAALTHRLRKMKSKMVKCKHCENYIVVNGVECEEVRNRGDGQWWGVLRRTARNEWCWNWLIMSCTCLQCGLAMHRKCMEVCQLECENRKGTVFGVDLSLMCQDEPDKVPFVVRLCTTEIENRALSVQVLFISQSPKCIIETSS